MSEKSFKKRKRSEEKDLPSFLDASASVSASTFGARRLPEIKALWNAQLKSSITTDQQLCSSGGKTSSRHLRRRTTSHMPRRRHRKSVGQAQRDRRQAGNNKRPCRRARRKPALLRQKHGIWQSDMRDPQSVECVYWLTTHLWHAKRFHMHDNMFGWKVPLVHANRGARAALRMATEHHTLLQDVTWRKQPVLIGSSDLKVLITSVQRICPNLLSANPNAILSGNCFGEGMIYDVDKFPTSAVGPAMWWMSGQTLDSLPAVEAKGRRWYLHIVVHPAIRPTIQELLSDLSNDVSLLEGPCGLKEGLACFQLRGRNATRSIQRALGPTACNLDADDTSSCTFDWDKTTSMMDLHTQVPHLTAISVHASFHRSSSMECPDESTETGDAFDYIDCYKERILQLDPMKGPSISAYVGGHRIILVACCQGDSSLSQNAAVIGWDLFCHPSDASIIFNALAKTGGARVIGLVEESLTRMESEPSLPVFPRDYPDTPAGQCYWDNDSSEWQLVRKCLEHGWGQVHIAKAIKQSKVVDDEVWLPIVSWSHISTLPENASNSATSAVVVRGDYGKPFVDALAGCGHIPLVSEANKTKRRRPRRRVRPSSVPVPLGRLSHEEVGVHHNMCKTLLQSLSLPALIRCHIKTQGKGTVVAGGRILASMCDTEEQTGYIDYLLGTIVAGSFSITRGLAHGIGFVGAARLLHVLSSDRGRLSCVASKRLDGTRHVELHVFVKATNRGCVQRAATLSLLL